MFFEGEKQGKLKFSNTKFQENAWIMRGMRYYNLKGEFSLFSWLL